MRSNSVYPNSISRMNRRGFLKSCIASGLLAGSASAVRRVLDPGERAAQAVLEVAETTGEATIQP